MVTSQMMDPLFISCGSIPIFKIVICILFCFSSAISLNPTSSTTIPNNTELKMILSTTNSVMISSTANATSAFSSSTSPFHCLDNNECVARQWCNFQKMKCECLYQAWSGTKCETIVSFGVFLIIFSCVNIIIQMCVAGLCTLIIIKISMDEVKECIFTATSSCCTFGLLALLIGMGLNILKLVPLAHIGYLKLADLDTTTLVLFDSIESIFRQSCVLNVSLLWIQVTFVATRLDYESRPNIRPFYAILAFAMMGCYFLILTFLKINSIEENAILIGIISMTFRIVIALTFFFGSWKLLIVIGDAPGGQTISTTANRETYCLLAEAILGLTNSLAIQNGVSPLIALSELLNSVAKSGSIFVLMNYVYQVQLKKQLITGSTAHVPLLISQFTASSVTQIQYSRSSSKNLQKHPSNHLY